MPVDNKADSGSPEGWEEVQADTESKREKVTNTEDHKAQKKTENSGSGAKTPKVEQLVVEKLDNKKPESGAIGGDPPKLEPQQDEKTQDDTPKSSPIFQSSVGKKTRCRIKNPIRAKIVLNELDIVIAALNYLNWGKYNSSLPLQNQDSQDKFDHLMNGYYQAARDAEGGYTPPVGAVLQFTNLYDSSRFMLDEIRLAKGGPLNRGDVRALSLVIIKDLPRIPLPGNPEIDPHLRLRLKALLQRTFRAHGKLDPQVIPDEDDEDTLALKDVFAEGLKRIYDAVVEALPHRLTFERILMILVAFSCAGALYYWVWKFSMPIFWNASPSAGRSDDINIGGESTSAYSGSPFAPLHQWVELYKGDMNMAADTYEDCEFWITSAGDLVARRTESLTTELQMLAMKIWLSKLRILQPFSRLFNIPSEESLNAKALILYESYLSDVDNEKHYPESHAKMLRVSLGILETDMQQIEKEYRKSFPFQFRKLFEEVGATFRGKKPEPLLRPDVLEPFHLHYNYFLGLAEDSVFESFGMLNNLKDAIAAQRGGEKPLQEQINEISTAIAELKFAKESAMLTKNNLETNGTMREAGVAIWAL